MSSEQPPSGPNGSTLSTRYAVWAELESAREQWRSTSLIEEFDRNPERAKQLSATSNHLFLDFSKTHLNPQVLSQLCTLAEQAGLRDAMHSVFSGDHYNHTEHRKVLHSALRSPNTNTDEEKAVQETLAKMSKFVSDVHSDTWSGFSGKPITDVVNIGIGGSDLGPRMVTAALAPFHLSHTKVHFVANIDGADLSQTLARLEPQTTLFIVASKSFTTLETLENSLSAKQWLLDAGCESADIAKHFVAITANISKAVEFGITEDNLFPMWDWVGGRYSLWSAIGLPVALAVGMKRFKKLLSGAHQMDVHFRETPFEKNLPVIQALIAFWYAQFWQTNSQVILPYSHVLEFFPAFLQQLDMESLGKGTDRDGNKINYPTGQVIWGTEGTNGQHSFHQLLHQGTQLIPADFIVCKKAQHKLAHHQAHLFACCLSQSQALMTGKTLEQARKELVAGGMTEEQAIRLAPHKIVPGNRPSTTLVMDELTPEALGELIALYEHKVFVLSVLLNISAFDQWGVELGKQLSGPIYTALDKSAAQTTHFDSSTQQLINRFLKKGEKKDSKKGKKKKDKVKKSSKKDKQ